MHRVREGTIGILPAGALGVSFFHHLTHGLKDRTENIFFLQRSGSKSATALRLHGALHIATAETVEQIPATVLHGDLLSAFEQSALPEVLLLCPNPDQLPDILNAIVHLLERMSQRDELVSQCALPALVLSSNGIYYQRLRQQFIERLEESTLLGRLPDLWPVLMPRIVGHLLRGVTIQTGLRDGSGANVVYRPSPAGITRLAGGDPTLRERACELLRNRGGWFELARHSSATRLEFDKAMVNLTANLLGLLYAIDAQGHFTALQVQQIVTAQHQLEIREMARRVFEIGRAVKAYGADEPFDEILAQILETTHQHDTHVPSSLQWIGLRLRQGKLEPTLTPTEEWLLEPLIRYAHAAGLHDTGHYFENLKQQAIAKLMLATNKADASKHHRA